MSLYRVRPILRLMNNKDQNPQYRTINSTQPQVTLSANSVAIANPPKHSKKTILYIIDAILLLAILIVLFAVLPKLGNPKKSSPTHSLTSSTSRTQAQSITQTNNNSVVNPTQNPLNNNGSINSQVKYCSNVVNAELVC